MHAIFDHVRQTSDVAASPGRAAAIASREEEPMRKRPAGARRYGLAALAATLATCSRRRRRSVQQQDRIGSGRASPVFRSVGAGGGRRQEGFRHRLGRLQSAVRVEAQSADRIDREPDDPRLQRLWHLPRRRGRHQFDGRRACRQQCPVDRARRLRPGSDQGRLLPRDRRVPLRVSRNASADQGDGRQGQNRPSRRPPG